MYCKIIDLYFSPAGEQLTSAGESAETLDPLEITAGETFIIRASCITAENSDGRLTVHPVQLSPDTSPELRGVSAGDGEIMFAAAGSVSGNSMIFAVNTSTGIFREAAADQEREFFLVFADVSRSDVSPCQFGRIPFRALRQCDWSLTPPEETPPEHLSRSAVMALWQSDIQFSFSPDRQQWHSSFTAGDTYFRISRPAGGSGPALPIPSCSRIRIDSFGTAAQRPGAGTGPRLYLDDTSGMVSCSDGNSWSSSFPLTGPAGTKGRNISAVPVFYPCIITAEGTAAAELKEESPEAVFLIPVQLPAEIELFWQESAGNAVLQITGTDSVLAQATVDASAGRCSMLLAGEGREQLTLRRLTGKSGDTCPGPILLTGAILKYTDI